MTRIISQVAVGLAVLLPPLAFIGVVIWAAFEYGFEEVMFWSVEGGLTLFVAYQIGGLILGRAARSSTG
jgi:hypothetical protein